MICVRVLRKKGIEESAEDANVVAQVFVREYFGEWPDPTADPKQD